MYEGHDAQPNNAQFSNLSHMTAST